MATSEDIHVATREDFFMATDTAELERENKELRRANEILKTAAACDRRGTHVEHGQVCSGARAAGPGRGAVA
jgi:hypothetical protein